MRISSFYYEHTCTMNSVKGYFYILIQTYMHYIYVGNQSGTMRRHWNGKSYTHTS